MQDPMTLLFIIVIGVAVAAFWMMDTSRRAQAGKSRKLLSEARERADRAESSLAQARSDRDEAKKKAESLTKQRDQLRKTLQKAKSKKRGRPEAEAANDSAADVEDATTVQLRQQLDLVAEELEARVQRIADLEARLEAQAEAHAEALMRASTRAVKPVREIPEEARTDLRLFLGKMKGEIQTLERKASSSHRAYMAAEGRAEALIARLAGLQERYRAVCRELAIGAGANADIGDEEAVAQAEQAVETMEEAAAWSRLDGPAADLEAAADEAADEDVEAAETGSDEEPADEAADEDVEAAETGSDEEPSVEAETEAEMTPADDEEPAESEEVAVAAETDGADNSGEAEAAESAEEAAETEEEKAAG